MIHEMTMQTTEFKKLAELGDSEFVLRSDEVSDPVVDDMLLLRETIACADGSHESGACTLVRVEEVSFSGEYSRMRVCLDRDTVHAS